MKTKLKIITITRKAKTNKITKRKKTNKQTKEQKKHIYIYIFCRKY